MREIKFRAWDTSRKKMYSTEELGADQETLSVDGRGFINVSGDRTELSQFHTHLLPLEYIGLKDKNGTEIFEGDIIQWWNKVSRPQAVEATNGGCNPFIDSATTDHPYHYEIIGNIYENKELLEVANA